MHVISSKSAEICNAPVCRAPTHSGSPAILLELLPSQIMSMIESIHTLVAKPSLHDYLAILKGARNGFVYGVKVRFPHALIMAILFGRGT